MCHLKKAFAKLMNVSFRISFPNDLLVPILLLKRDIEIQQQQAMKKIGHFRPDVIDLMNRFEPVA